MSVRFATLAQRIQLADNISAVRNCAGATICGWVNLTGKTALQTLASLTINTDRIASRCGIYAVATDTIHIRISGQALDADTATSFVSTSLSMTAGVWQFLAGIFDYVNRRMTIYLNTSSELSPLLTGWTSGNCSNTTTLANTIGNKDPAFANFPLNGSTDDLRIYNRILSAEELKTIFYCRGTDSIVYGLQSRHLMNSKQTGFVTVGGEIAVDVKGGFNGVYSAGCTYMGTDLKYRSFYQ